MAPIESWNMLMFEASTKKVKLHSFREDDFGFFYACWRTADNVLGPDLKRRQPFIAALDAYLALRDDAPAAEPEPQNDLFG